MRKIILSSVISVALGTASFAGFAATTATLAVKGSIQPTACDISLSAASFDFSTISAASLTQPINSKMGDPLTLDLACSGATAVAVQVTDNRAASAMTTAEVQSDMGVNMGTATTNASLFGIGTHSTDKKVGFLQLSLSEAKLNGAASSNVLTSSDKITWNVLTVSPSKRFSLEKNGYFSLATSASASTPAAVTNASYTITPAIVLKKSSQYPGGEAINIDGNVTFSVVYI
ncbi:MULTISPECIES: DUF1120 domain-containing protein [Pantoea]|jgi:type 1 fimbria pilin|uniref:DUF1120 domain-containing protein n=1 Tax=Pantoea TaxID=53335 RepID=UPI000EA0D1DC|nr:MULTISPECIES: DUF1120 domain-containing protein [Pantoea]MBZ6386473.1 DUF1120 domain-containing protein [Pantoea piersonii]MBZ6398524.1 DUF1120 domain-containing protein [Pantoea piersonii]MBZ6408139.1 DUF1120 domain-containing protein [Pantoea piersonii]MBZ6426045.1 DUF1120 domain-containing protein [Pantoea piersonii]NYB02606.1 DUF1120 domain-containing protein [Pantoea piersonii]